MSLAYWYLFALLAIPFYIGPELAPNVQINAERLLLMLLAMFFVHTLRFRKRSDEVYGLFYSFQLFMLLFTLFFIWRGLAAFVSPYRVSGYLFIYELVSNYLIFIIFYVTVFRVHGFFRVLRVLKFGLIVIFCFALLEAILGESILSRFALSDAGQAINATSIWRSGLLRVKSVFEHPLTLGHFLVMALPLILFIGRKYLLLREKILLLILILSMIIMTGSRATMLIAMCIIIIFFLISGPRIRLNNNSVFSLKSILLPILLITPIVIIGLVEERTGSEAFMSYTRYAQIVNGFIAIGEKPWFGFGQGPGGTAAIESVVRYGAESLKLWERNFNTIDNWFLSILLASGYPSLFLFIGFNLVILFTGLRCVLTRSIRNDMHAQGDYGLMIGVFLSLCAGFLFMIILSIFTLHPLYYILMAGFMYLTEKYMRASRMRKKSTNATKYAKRGKIRRAISYG